MQSMPTGSSARNMESQRPLYVKEEWQKTKHLGRLLEMNYQVRGLPESKEAPVCENDITHYQE